jgi:hypothetical protein
MTALLDIALDCIRRGWYVHPLKPGGKIPVTKHGKNDATLDEARVREWWNRNPTCNVGISYGPSGLCVLDADHGLQNEGDFTAWRDRNGLPVTYAVRSGRRDEFGVQSYYVGSLPDGRFELDGVRGDIKSAGGLVLAAGDIHPVSGEAYHVLADSPLAPVPAIVDQSRVRQQISAGLEGGDITENRNLAMTSILGKMRDAGLSDGLLRDYAIRTNEARMKPALDEDELEGIIRNACKWPIPAPEPVVHIGSPKEPEQPRDWRTLFHTREEALNAPPITFLIDGFLQREGVTAIAGPVRERKSLIALNVAHALVAGEKLFDYFDVAKKPERVLYLCPEVSLGPFTDRLKKIGLMDSVGDRLFYRTLSADGTLSLNDPALFPALPGSVVILDTAIRFLEGDENSSQDVRAFADGIFELLRAGAEAVVLLHHSPKDSGDTMTLENAMRGSDDMGAFLCCCWGTKLQDPTKPYESASFLSNLKQRDFESKDFEVMSGPDCRMHIVGDPATRPVTLQSRKGNRANKDGLDDAAEAVIRANIKLPVRKLQEQLAALNINRGTTWIARARARIQSETGVMTVGA